jgi:hypothetical protein
LALALQLPRQPPHPPHRPRPHPPPPSPGPNVEHFNFYLVQNGLYVDVSWDESAYADSYSIYRSEDGGATFVLLVGGLPKYSPTYTDATVLGGGVGTPNYYIYYMIGSNAFDDYVTDTQIIGVE